jgi:DNA-directed RNA polymerase alpha subunit
MMYQTADETAPADPSTPLDELSLNTRAYNALRRDGIETVEQVLRLTDEQLLGVRNLGAKGLAEIKASLAEYLEDHPALRERQTQEEVPAQSHRVTDRSSIDVLGLSARPHNALNRAGVETLAQLMRLSEEELLTGSGIGKKSIVEIKKKLAQIIEAHPILQALKVKEESEVPKTRVIDMSPVKVLTLSPRARNALLAAGVDTIDQLAALTEGQRLDLRGIGKKSAAEIERTLAHYLDVHLEFLVEQEQLAAAPSLAAPEQLERCSAIPLDYISVSRLSLPPLESTYLTRQDITSIEALARQPTAAFPKDALLVDRLTQYLDWLAEQDEEVWAAEAMGKCPSPIHRIILSHTSLDALMKEWLSCLTGQAQEILRCRLGGDGPRMTLAEIGARMDLSGERIRQIESWALQSLSGRKAQETIDSLIQCLIQVFADAGELMTEEEVQDSLVDLMTVGTVDTTWASRLLLLACDKFQEAKKGGPWGLSRAPLELVPPMQRTLNDILQEIGGLVQHDQLLARFKETPFHQEHHTHYDTAFIEACLRTHPNIKRVEGQYMTRKRYRKQAVKSVGVQTVEVRPKPTVSKPPKIERQTLAIDLENVKRLDKPPETLDEWERYLRPQVRQVELLGEISLTKRECAQLGKVIGLRVRALGHSRAVRTLCSKYPCALAVYLVTQGIYGYRGGDYWTKVVQTTGFSRPRASEVGRAFEDILEALDLPLFYDMRAEANRYVSLILAHGGIPTYCLADFFAHMLQPSVLRAEYADMSAAEVIEEWLWHPGIVQFTDKPVTRFLQYGGRVAQDFVARCREMAWTFLDTGARPTPEAVGLPERVVAAYGEWINAQDPEQVERQTGERWRLRKPRVLVDPWGEGVLIDLPPQQVPATEIYADIAWQVTADAAVHHVPVHVRRVGFDRKTTDETLPLTRPPAAIEVSLRVDGASKRTWRYQGVDAERPLLVFDPERGTLLSWTLSLPAGPLGLLYPADRELHVEGEARMLEELPRLPWGWSTFRGEIWDLTDAQKLVLPREEGKPLEVALRPDEAARRPTLEGGRPFAPAQDEEGEPVYVGVPPRVRVPLTERQAPDEQLKRWRIRVRNRWSADPEVDVETTLGDLKEALTVTERYVELPLSLPSLLGKAPCGNFSVRLRGPLGRDAAFTLRAVPHFTLLGHEELYVPADQTGPQPAVLMAETPPGDRIECQGEDVACQVRVTERGEAAWQHEIEVGPDVTAVELTVVHPHPSDEAVRVPIHVPIRRLRWALVDDEAAARRGAWTGSMIRRPMEALDQLRSPFLLVRLPLPDPGDVQLGLRLLDEAGEVCQATERMTLVGRRMMGHFDLGAFLDTIRASRSPFLRLELTVWSLPGWDRPLRLPVLSLTQTLLVEDAALAARTADRRVIFDLTWHEPTPLRNRHVRFWPLWRPWDPVFEKLIPDEAEGKLSFSVPPRQLQSGKYRLEFRVVDPWTAGDGTPQRPERDTPSTADVELIPVERQLEILDERLQRDGRSFETVLERIAIHQDIGDPEGAAPDRQWCYEHLDEGTLPQQLALADLLRAADEDGRLRSLQLKLFAAGRIERLMAKRAAGTVPPEHFRAYMDNMPRSGMLPVTTSRALLSVEDETVRLHAVQQLIRREHPAGPEAVLGWVDEARLSDADAVALLALQAEHSAEVLKKHMGNRTATRLLKALAPELGDKTPIVHVGSWVYTDAGWGRIERIEDLAERPVQQFLKGQTEYRLYVTLRPDVDAEPVVVDLKRKLITFTAADVIHTCTKCYGFSAQNPYLIVERHDRVAHGGIGPKRKREKILRRSLRRCIYRTHMPVKQGLGLPPSLQAGG